MGFAVEAGPDRIERPFGNAAAVADPAQPQLGRRHGDLLEGRGGAVIGAERPINQQHIEARGSRPPARRRAGRRTCPPMKLMPPTSAITSTKPVPDSERCGVMIAEKSVGSGFGSLSGRVCGVMLAFNIGQTWPRKPTRNATGNRTAPATGRDRRAKGEERQGGEGRKDEIAKAEAGESAGLASRKRRLGSRPRSRRRSAAFAAAMPEPEGRTPAHQSVHAAGRGGAVGAGDRCRRQQGDAGAVRARRHAGEDGGARRGRGARIDQDHRAVPHQGQERGRAVGEARRRAW